MASWPWLKDVGMTVNHPISSVHTGDDRASVKELIESNRTKIDGVAQLLQDDALYNGEKHDDLWILRYILSHKTVKASAAAAKATLAFREKYKLDQEDLRNYPFGPTAKSEAVQRYLKYGFHDRKDVFISTVPDKKLGVILYINYGAFDQHGLVKNISEEDWLLVLIYISEWSFQWLDYVTRTTGRLTKSIRILDVGEVTLKGINMECAKQDAKAMKVTEDKYPQLLAGIKAVNVPKWIHVPWKVLRPLFPKRMVEKLDFVNPVKNAKDLTAVLKYVAPEHLPTKYGGKNDVWPPKP